MYCEGAINVATTNYTLRIDETDKQRAEQIFRALGMNLSTGLTFISKRLVVSNEFHLTWIWVDNRKQFCRMKKNRKKTRMNRSKHLMVFLRDMM